MDCFVLRIPTILASFYKRIMNILFKMEGCDCTGSTIIMGIFQINGSDTVYRIYPEMSTVSAAPAESTDGKNVVPFTGDDSDAKSPTFIAWHDVLGHMGSCHQVDQIAGNDLGILETASVQ